MADTDIFLGKFTETVKPILQEALKMTNTSGQKHLSEAHVIVAFHNLKPEMFNLGVSQTKMTAAQVVADAERVISELSGFHKKGVKIHSSATKLFKRAMRSAEQKERRRIDALDLLAAIKFAPTELDSDAKDDFEPTIIVWSKIAVKFFRRRLLSSRFQ